MIKWDVGRGYVVNGGGGAPLTCVDLRLDGDDVEEVQQSDLREPREPNNPFFERCWYVNPSPYNHPPYNPPPYNPIRYRARRVLFWRAKLQVGDKVLRQGAGGDWVEAKIEKVVATHVPVRAMYSLPTAQVVCKDTTYLNKRAITRARQHARLWGAGMSAPPQPGVVERHVIFPATATHLMGWVFRTEFVEVLKMTAHNIERGCSALLHPPTHPPRPTTPTTCAHTICHLQVIATVSKRR